MDAWGTMGEGDMCLSAFHMRNKNHQLGVDHTSAPPPSLCNGNLCSLMEAQPWARVRGVVMPLNSLIALSVSVLLMHFLFQCAEMCPLMHRNLMDSRGSS